MKEKGYANAVVFDPDKMSDFKKEICDLYDLSVVTVDGVVWEKGLELLLSNFNRRSCGL
ncbi:hypothetical protein [Synechococcus sp. UW179B]|uniref:hypothetical protein n=1 Tax=Synechococcus sp. UW179B TaxID=2575516 RepID=UPI0014838CE6|nr:hypothetical protein [Synechococcus sp. UW179B]